MHGRQLHDLLSAAAKPCSDDNEPWFEVPVRSEFQSREVCRGCLVPNLCFEQAVRDETRLVRAHIATRLVQGRGGADPLQVAVKTIVQGVRGGVSVNARRVIVAKRAQRLDTQARGQAHTQAQASTSETRVA